MADEARRVPQRPVILKFKAFVKIVPGMPDRQQADKASGAPASAPAATSKAPAKQSAVSTNDRTHSGESVSMPHCKSSASSGSEAQFMSQYSGMQYYSCESKYKDPAGAEYSNMTTMMFLPLNKP